jgi:hypothetical protein
MTEALSHAFLEAQKLSSEEQNVIAAIILEEIKDEESWSLKFAESQGALSRLAEKVRQDIREGRIVAQSPEEL